MTELPIGAWICIVTALILCIAAHFIDIQASKNRARKDGS